MKLEAEARVTGFLGLCTRAGQVIFGQEPCVTAVRNGQIAVALLDEQSSPNTRKRLEDTCKTHDVMLFEWSHGILETAVGRAGLKVVAVKRGSMGMRLREMLKSKT